MVSNPWLEGIEAIMLRTVGDQESLWEAVLPDEVRRLPKELARVDAMLHDPAFFAPFVPFFDPRIGRPSTPMDVYHGLNEALLAKAAEAKLLRTARVRVDTMVLPANVSLPDRLGPAGQGGAPDRRERPPDPSCRWRDPHTGCATGHGQLGSSLPGRLEASVTGSAG
jgi:IS5 family transposase